MERRRRIQRTQRPRRVAAASSAAHRRCMAERQLGRPCRLPNSVTSRDESTCGFVGVVIEMADGWRPPPSRSRSSTGPFPPCAGGITMSTALSYLAARSEPKVLPARRVWQAGPRSWVPSALGTTIPARPGAAAQRSRSTRKSSLPDGFTRSQADARASHAAVRSGPAPCAEQAPSPRGR